MRCIIHIGTEKTGSTAIQNYLCSNQQQLIEEGVHLCASMGDGNSRALPAAMMRLDKVDDFIRGMQFESDDTRKTWKKQVLARLTAEIREAAKKSRVFLITSEHFHSRLLTSAEVCELREFLAQYFDEFEIVCYLRRQDHLARSFYSEALRAGYTPQSTLPLAKMRARKHNQLPLYFDFESLLQRWAAAFGESSIRPRLYSRESFFGGDVVHDFLHTVGLRTDLPVQAPTSNPALSSEAQAVLLRINELFSAQQLSSAASIRNQLVRYLEQQAPGNSRMPTGDEAREYYQYFAASNSEVAKRWFGRDQLFGADFSEYPDEDQTADANKVIDLLAGFMVQHFASTPDAAAEKENARG